MPGPAGSATWMTTWQICRREKATKPFATRESCSWGVTGMPQLLHLGQSSSPHTVASEPRRGFCQNSRGSVDVFGKSLSPGDRRGGKKGEAVHDMPDQRSLKEGAYGICNTDLVVLGCL